MGQLVAFVFDPAAWALLATVHSRQEGEKHRLSLQATIPIHETLSPHCTTLLPQCWIICYSLCQRLSLSSPTDSHINSRYAMLLSPFSFKCYPVAVSLQHQLQPFSSGSSHPSFPRPIWVCPSAHNAPCVPARISSVKSHDLSQSRSESCGGFFCLSGSITKLHRGSHRED